MLTSKKLELRRSEIRQSLAELAANDNPSEAETRKMTDLDTEYRTAETRYRAALIAEDEERQEAKGELETRSGTEWAEMMGKFEMRQVALALDEGREMTGQTGEIVQEMRSAGGYRGIPVPWAAMETRAGETIASGTPDPMQTRPIIDRLFPDSVAGKMGAQMINIDHGEVEWPVTTAGATVGWQATETGNVAGPSAYATTDRALAPDNTLGVQMKITRKSLKQSGAALEQAIRRDMNGAMSGALDAAVFLGAGSSGEPLGIIPGAATYGITSTAVDAEPEYSDFLAEVVAFMTANAITNPGEIRALMRPELFGVLEGKLNSVTQTTEYNRLALLLTGRKPTGFSPSNIHMTSNALAAPTEESSGDPRSTTMVMTTSTGGVAPVFVGAWGAVDLVRDPFSDAQSGGLRLTALATLDVTVARAVQLRILTGLQEPSGSLMLWGAASGAMELRAENGGVRVVGRFPYANETELATRRRETFEARAFAARVNSGEEIHMLFGHDFDRPLASRAAGSLEVTDSDTALEFRAEIVGNTTWAADFLAAHEGGLIRGLSPGFRVPTGGARIERRGDDILRTVTAANLFEISAVTRPAYPAAQIEARAWGVKGMGDHTFHSGLHRTLNRWRA